VVGPIIAILLIDATAAFDSSMVRPTADAWSAVLPLLTIALQEAALNAFAEEVLPRAGLL
jgi:hypothetical protein